MMFTKINVIIYYIMEFLNIDIILYEDGNCVFILYDLYFDIYMNTCIGIFIYYKI